MLGGQRVTAPSPQESNALPTQESNALPAHICNAHIYCNSPPLPSGARKRPTHAAGDQDFVYAENKCAARQWKCRPTQEVPLRRI